jgi:hypothetical protein
VRHPHRLGNPPRHEDWLRPVDRAAGPAAASKSILYDTLDPDCFWHLRVAEQLQRDGIRPLVDPMSFMSIKDPWTPYSWLAELG